MRLFRSPGETNLASEFVEIKGPKIWEANLLTASLLILIMVGGGIAGAFGLSVLLISQLLLLLPVLVWIAIRRYPLKSTLRLQSIKTGLPRHQRARAATRNDIFTVEK
jgi:hypothetical protein